MKLLIVYHAGFSYIPCVYQYVDAFRKHSRHTVAYFNIDDPETDLDFSAFDAVLLSYDALAAARHARDFNFKPVANAMRAFGGLKIVAVQDEYDLTDRLKFLLKDIRAGVVLTCVPQQHVEKIYPRAEFPGVRFETVLTGYVSDELRLVGLDAIPLAERFTVVGYRGRELSLRLGDLGWHKAEVGRRVANACAVRGVPCDIAINEEARIYGDDWFDFNKSCRVMLGSPSGSNVFDHTGSLQERMLAQWKIIGNGMQYSHVRDWVTQHECGFDMGQISPRVFEAAACHTALALVAGSYSGLLNPDEHYIEIKRDYSNLDAVLDRFDDLDALQDMADRTHEHLIGNGANSYFSFVAMIDRMVFESANGWNPWAGRPALRTTPAPLGNDPYLLSRISMLNGVCTQMEKYMRGLLRGEITVGRQSEGFTLMDFEGDHSRPN